MMMRPLEAECPGYHNNSRAKLPCSVFTAQAAQKLACQIPDYLIYYEAEQEEEEEEEEDDDDDSRAHQTIRNA